MDEHTISPAGDPFSAVKQSQPIAVGLHELEERLAHELMEDEKRQELRDRVRRLRRRLGP